MAHFHTIPVLRKNSFTRVAGNWGIYPSPSDACLNCRARYRWRHQSTCPEGQ